MSLSPRNGWSMFFPFQYTATPRVIPYLKRQAALRLRPGCNTIEFVVNVAGQAERVVSARAFLWGSGARVVVSDIENTIARRYEV
ncbi:unnamed protein product [Ectocarpus sp. 12 AP-2014]